MRIWGVPRDLRCAVWFAVPRRAACQTGQVRQEQGGASLSICRFEGSIFTCLVSVSLQRTDFMGWSWSVWTLNRNESRVKEKFNFSQAGVKCPSCWGWVSFSLRASCSPECGQAGGQGPEVQWGHDSIHRHRDVVVGSCFRVRKPAPGAGSTSSRDVSVV